MENYENRPLNELTAIMFLWGSGDSSVVRASDSRSKGPGFESRQERGWGGGGGGEEVSTPGSTFCAHSYFSIRYRSST